jgi:hypothetical protein
MLARLLGASLSVVEISLPGVVPPEFFWALLIPAVLVFGFVVIDAVFTVHDRLVDRRAHRLGARDGARDVGSRESSNGPQAPFQMV